MTTWLNLPRTPPTDPAARPPYGEAPPLDSYGPASPSTYQPAPSAPASGSPTPDAPTPGSRTPDAPTPGSRTPGPTRRWGRRLGVVLAALAVVAASTGGGYLAGSLAADDASPTARPAVVETALPAPTTAPPEPADDEAAPSPGAPADDPAAVAAAIVAPSVVRLGTGFGLGSGVIYDASGLVLTAAHVVQGSTTVEVILADGTIVDGEVVGTHRPTDVAVVQIDADPNLPVAELATGVQLQVGQLAVAVGSPFGLDQTVTAGIVSAAERSVPPQQVAMVQTDAAINPGNSGGPLVDSEGRVIGINDLIFSSSGGNEGVGFAISIDLASLVADQLVEGGPVSLAFLGVSSGTSPTGEAGALVQSVSPGSAAEDAGLRAGDRIVGVDGEAIRHPEDLRNDITTLPPGEEVDLTVVREGREIEIPTVLGSTG